MIFTYLYHTITLHCLMLLVSLPILVLWGLPISIMVLAGNLIIVPLVTLFLCLAALLFFLQLLYLPCGLLGSLLNTITSALNWLLKLGSESWLIGFAKPPGIMVLCISGICLYVLSQLHTKKYNTCMSIITILAVNILFYAGYTHLQRINYKNKEVLPKLWIVKDSSGSFSLHDHGACARKRSIEKFATYEVTPAIIKEVGSCPLKKVTTSRPSKKLQCFTQSLQKTFTIEYPDLS